MRWQIVGVDTLCDDLTAEHEDLDRLVAGADLEVVTPAPGWAVADQISHLWFFDQRALMALTDPEAFRVDAEQLLRGGTDVVQSSRAAISRPTSCSIGGTPTVATSSTTPAPDPKLRVPWYGPAMSAGRSSPLG